MLHITNASKIWSMCSYMVLMFTFGHNHVIEYVHIGGASPHLGYLVLFVWKLVFSGSLYALNFSESLVNTPNCIMSFFSLSCTTKYHIDAMNIKPKYSHSPLWNPLDGINLSFSWTLQSHHLLLLKISLCVLFAQNILAFLFLCESIFSTLSESTIWSHW